MNDLPTKREIAERYVQKQLATMDGSFEAALRRIGTERYEELVKEIMKVTRTGYSTDAAALRGRDD